MQDKLAVWQLQETSKGGHQKCMTYKLYIYKIELQTPGYAGGSLFIIVSIDKR